jgi:hypothetical protein
MKLLLCTKCGDVRALRPIRWTRCYCRKSRGRYSTNIHAEVAGPRALLLGFHNASLRAAVWRELADRKTGIARDLGHVFEAFVIPHASPHVRTLEARRRKNA